MPLTIVQPGVGGTGVSTFPSPGANGNILTSNGTVWTSAAPAGGGVTSLNGNTGALKGMTLLSTTNVTAATTIDITNIPTTAGTTYLLQIQGRTVGASDDTAFSLRYSTNNGSTFATTAIMSSTPTYTGGSTINQYMGDALHTRLLGATNIFSQIILSNGGTVNGAGVYPTAMSTLSAGDYENGDSYGRYFNAAVTGEDTNYPMVSGGGTVRGAVFNAIRIIRRTGSQTFTGNVKLFVIGV